MALQINPKPKFRGNVGLTDDELLNGKKDQNSGAGKEAKPSEKETPNTEKGENVTVHLGAKEFKGILDENAKNAVLKEGLRKKKSRSEPKHEKLETINCNSTIHRRIKLIAFMNDVTMREWIEEKLMQALEKEEKKLSINKDTLDSQQAGEA